MKTKFNYFKKFIFIFAAAVMLLGYTACFDTPYVAPFRISASEVELSVDESVKLTTNASGAVDWISLDEDIAVVDNGVITAISAGETTVIAVYAGVQEECAVKVLPDVTDPPDEPVTVTISQMQAALEAGEELTLTATVSDGSAAVWTSSNEAVATVKDGIVYGVSAGKAFIIASSGAANATCEVTVVKKPEPVTVTLSVPTAMVSVQQSIKLTATVSDGSAAAWSSSNEEVATVNGGVVYGVSVGKTTITAAAGEVSATCEITVINDPDTVKNGYTLFWHDEFNGESLNMGNWSYQLGTKDHYGESVGADNWGNNELQSYKENNVKLEDGLLVITAQKENPRVDGKAFTSGRITSRGKFTTLYGYVEARIKLPAISGMWPAFWMLPQPSSTDKTGNVYGGWAANGELDIMEARGRIPTEIDTTLHFGGKYPQNTYKSKKAYLDTPISEWHTYAVDWRKEYIAWIVDGKETFRMSYTQWWTSAVSSEENPYAPFDVPFYIVMNLAVGGTYDSTGANDIKANEDFVSASMYVDYVRVYKPEN